MRTLIAPSSQHHVLAGSCAVCWKKATIFCPDCTLIGYCCPAHLFTHSLKHSEHLCKAVEKLRSKNVSSAIYGCTKNRNPDQWRSLRITALAEIEDILKRPLNFDEKDLVLFPKHCLCLEMDLKYLKPCPYCNQTWYCKFKPGHLSKTHGEWCKSLQLFSLLAHQQARGESPKTFYMDYDTQMPKLNTMNSVLKQAKEELDMCSYALLTEDASGPLTILYALNLLQMLNNRKSLCVHLIGAESHYEAKNLDVWEIFFLHLFPQLEKLNLILIGPELNMGKKCADIKLCEKCHQRNRQINVEFHNCILYHNYCKQKKVYKKPDIVCAFNPGLHRTTGYKETDTWPETILAALKKGNPFIFTAYTAHEAPKDLIRVQSCSLIDVIRNTSRNPFSSQRPQRNFISDQDAPLIYKNFYLNVVKKYKEQLQ